LKLRPFADCADYRIWLTRPGKVSTAPVSKTAFGRESISSRGETDHGSFSDERTDLERSTRRTGPAWFAVELREPGEIGRVVVARGKTGWFEGDAKVEVQAERNGPWMQVGSLAPGESEVKLAKPALAFAVRISGVSSGLVSLAELSAY
jgi:hypothetical protein